MDEDEVEQSSGGLYDVAPSFSPDFLTASAREREDRATAGGGLYESAKDREALNDTRGGSKSASSGADGGKSPVSGRSKSGDSSSKSDGKSGGLAGKLGSLGGKLGGLGGGGEGMMGLGQTTLPIIILVGVLILGFMFFIFLGQGSFADSFKTRMMEDWNTTTVSTKARTDNMINGVQLCGGDGSAYGDIAYANTGLSDEQIVDFQDAGFEYSEESGVGTLSYRKPDGDTVVITCDEAVGQTKNGDTVAQADLAADGATDGDGVDYEEVKQNILASLDLSSEVASVQGFSEAMKDGTIKEKYMVATRAYRGNMSSWFTPVTDMMVSRLGVSRDFFRNFEKSGDADKDKEYVDNLIAGKSDSEGVDTGESLEERATQIIENSEDPSCGAISASNEIEGVTAASETYKQILTASMYLESIDKTIAGYGNESPQATFTNVYMESGAAGSEYMQELFGGKALEQSSTAVKDVSAQSSSIDVEWGIEGVDEGDYRACEYIGNTTVYDNAGFISRIGSIFKKAWSTIIGFFKGGTKKITSAATVALNPQIAQYEKMKNNKYWGDDIDGAVLGNGTGSVAERYFGEHSKSEGQDIGTASEVMAFKHAQQEVIAENAWYDRQTKSPFDASSRHTFLGSIVYSLMPVATSVPSLSVTSTMSQLGNMVSSSVSSLLPTSSALSDAELLASTGDCVMLNSTTAVADVYCNPYYITDLSLTGGTPVQAFEAVAAMRYDTEGTYIGGYAYDDEDSNLAGQVYYTKGLTANVSKRDTNDPMYRDGPVNKEEASYGHHWPEVKEKVLEKYGEDVVTVGTPKGCESNWYHETRYKLDSSGAIKVPYETYEWFNLDWPIEWKYSRGPTNFEYAGYQSGWPNRLADGAVGQELAVNDEAPGECVLDFKLDEKKLPVVNINGALALYQIADGERGSEWGVADNNNVEWLAKSDFTQGRLHPCSNTVGLNTSGDEPDYDKYCKPYIENWGWGSSSGDDESMAQAVAESKDMSRWVSGTAFTMTDGGTSGANVGTVTEDFNLRFQDPTRGNANFWEEQKYYQAFVETQEWLYSAGMLKETPTTALLARYYEENPLDQSYEGILARYSGKSKEQVVAVLDYLNYAEFLAQYDATGLYPVVLTEEEILYESTTTETVVAAMNAVNLNEIVYEELRNKTVVV